MDIKRIDSNNFIDPSKKLEVNNDDLSSANKAAKDLAQSEIAFEVDSADSDAFSKLKNKVALAKEASRAEYIEKLKQSIASGQYNPNSAELADSMLKDGFAELLFS